MPPLGPAEGVRRMSPPIEPIPPPARDPVAPRPMGTKGAIWPRIRPKLGLEPSIEPIPLACIWPLVFLIPGCTPSPPPGLGLYGTKPPMPLNGMYAVLLPPLKYEPTPEKLYLVMVPELAPELEELKDWACAGPVHVTIRTIEPSHKPMAGSDGFFTAGVLFEISPFVLVTFYETS